MTNNNAPKFNPDAWDNSQSPEAFLRLMSNFYASHVGGFSPNVSFVQFLELMAVVEKASVIEKRDPDDWEQGVIHKYLKLAFDEAVDLFAFTKMSEQGLLYRSTCYQYARDDQTKTPLKSRYDPGGETYAGKWQDLQKSSKDTFRDAVIAACESDGLIYSENPDCRKEGYYQVGFYIGQFQSMQGTLWDSHFTREDCDGRASHKMGFTRPEQIVSVDSLVEPNYDFDCYFLCPPMTN